MKMFIKSNWLWLNNIKHLIILMILLNHMLELGSADLNEDQKIRKNLNKIKPMPNINFLMKSNNESFRLKELEEELRKYDYTEAKVIADLIRNDDEIIGVMKYVYEDEKDIDGYLYFAGIVNNLSRRLLIYRYIYNDIILKRNFKPSNKYFWLHRTLLPYKSLKLWYKVDKRIIKMASESSDIYQSANNLTDFIKKQFFNETNFQKTEKHFTFKHMPITTYYITKYHDIKVNVSIYVDFIKGDIIDYWFDIKILFDNRNVISALMISLNDINDSIKSNRILNNNENFKLYFDGKLFRLILINQLQSNNLQSYQQLNNNVNMTFEHVDSILAFAKSLMQNDRLTIYNAIYDAINESNDTNLCDYLQLYHGLVTVQSQDNVLTLVNNLRQFITLTINNDLIRNFPDNFKLNDYFDLVDSDYNEVSIYSKHNNEVIAKYRFVLLKENDIENYCYFNIEMSVNNFENWYWEYGINSSLNMSDFLDMFSKHKQFTEIYEI